MATNTISSLPLPPCRRKANDCFPLSHPLNLNSKNLVSSLIGSKLSLPPTNLRRGVPKHRCSTIATVSFSLPTAIPERASLEKLPKWSARAIKSFAMAEVEVRKLKYPNIGTESLLLGILVEGTSIAAKFLRANGITFFKVQEETLKLLGKADMFFRSPKQPPLTKPAQRALDWAVEEKLKSGESGEITVTHLLLGIWSVKESAGHKVLAALGFDDEKAKELAKSINEDVVLTYK